MKKEYSFIKKKFKVNFKKFKSYQKEVDTIDNYTRVWSNTYLDFFPFESILEGFKPPEIISQPAPNNDLVLNKYIDNQIFYAANNQHEEWGTIFYSTDGENQIRLVYDNQNSEDKMLLSQISYQTIENGLTQKVLYYMFDLDMDEKSAFLYTFCYNNKQSISCIVKQDLLNENNVISYKFEYQNETCKIIEVYSNSKGEKKEKKIYPK